MSVSCYLNRIDQSVLDEMAPGREALPYGQSMWDSTLLGRPADSYELGVRIWTFWQVGGLHSSSVTLQDGKC